MLDFKRLVVDIMVCKLSLAAETVLGSRGLACKKRGGVVVFQHKMGRSVRAVHALARRWLRRDHSRRSGRFAAGADGGRHLSVRRSFSVEKGGTHGLRQR